jgi:single-strand DNA-binding protein
MPTFNHVVLLGHMTRDPQTKQLGSTSVTEFGLAMNRRFKTAGGEDREETTFVDVSAFGRTGEVVSKYVTKGNPLLVAGRLKYDQWEDKQGGKRSKLSVVAESVQLLGGKRGQSDDDIPV